jgi:hypothetical protein
MSSPHRFHIWKPLPEDHHLTKIPGCFARLRTFDPEWQKAQGILPGERIVCLDFDLVITGQLDGLFDQPLGFVILQGVNATNPCPFNGSVWALQAGFGRMCGQTSAWAPPLRSRSMPSQMIRPGSPLRCLCPEAWDQLMACMPSRSPAGLRGPDFRRTPASWRSPATETHHTSPGFLG